MVSSSPQHSPSPYVAELLEWLDTVETLSEPSARARRYRAIGERYYLLHMFGRCLDMSRTSLDEEDQEQVRTTLAQRLVRLLGEPAFEEARSLVAPVVRVDEAGGPVGREGAHASTPAMRRMIDREIEQKRAAMARQKRRAEINQQYPALAPIVGESQHILDVCEQIIRYAPMRLAVLITGPTGSGKELVARAFHACGPRGQRPFVPVNCAAVPEQLFESEMFGHVRGAFTGADRPRRGHIEEAHGGTLFLDEIARMPLSVQPKLLRVLESGEYRRVGDSSGQHADVRVIAATNRDLAEMVRAGTFLEDLYSRLRGVEIKLWPLEDRLEDLPLLVKHFVAKHRLAAEDAPYSDYDIFSWLRWRYLIDQEAHAVAASPAEPWSIRDFEHAIMHAAADGELQRCGDYPVDPVIEARGRRCILPTSYRRRQLTDYDTRLALAYCPKQKDAAKLLGISQSALSRRRRTLGL
jgi:transcriptional regulator of acetoin/glycerol metabolism